MQIKKPTFWRKSIAMTVGRVGPTYKSAIHWRFWCFQGFEPLIGAEYCRAGRIEGAYV